MNPGPRVVTKDDSMESKSVEKEKLNLDDSPETADSEVGNKDEKLELEPEDKEGDLDFDVRPADTYLGPDYDPKKTGGSKALWLGVLMVAAIIGLSYYAFRSQPDPADYDMTGEKTVAVIPAPDSEQLPALPEKAPDAADFSPTPETEAAAAATSLPATASSSTSPTSVREPSPPVSPMTKSTDSANTKTRKTATTNQMTKRDESKSNSAATKSAETKPSTTVARPAESKPAATAAPSAETKPAATAAPSAESKSAVMETTSTPALAEAASSVTDTTKAEEVQPETPKSDTTQPEGAVRMSDADVKPALPEPPSTSTSSGTPAAASEISELWVVNISSTPDVAESNRLLNRVIATDVGGQVYFYETSIDGRVHHRIRVGFYTSRGEAEAVGQKVKETFQLSATPWVVKPTIEEVEKYRKK